MNYAKMFREICLISIFAIVAVLVRMVFQLRGLTLAFSLLGAGCLMFFLFWIGKEDAMTKMITRRKNLLFIGNAAVLYIIKAGFMRKISILDIAFVLIASVMFLLLGKTNKWGLGDSFLCIGTLLCYMTIFGSFYGTAFLITLFFSVLVVLLCRDKTVPFAPCLYAGSVLTLFCLFIY